MSLRISNSNVTLRGQFAFNKQPLPSEPGVGLIFRVVNLGQQDGSLSYTKIDGSTASTGNLIQSQVGYILAKSGSQVLLAGVSLVPISDEYPVGFGSIAITNLLITSSIDITPTFTEEVFTTTGAGSWTKPVGVTEVIVECWGGGGAGGGATANPAAGAGGASGQYSRKYIRYSSPSQVISYSIAATVTGTTGEGTTGNDTTWQTNVVVAKGGGGGGANGTSGTPVQGGIAATAGGIGDVIYNGFDGQQSAVSAQQGGNGGGGRGSTGTGQGGASGQEFGGDGGSAGAFITNDGTPGGNYGGGGGGGYTNTTTNVSGGAGAQGLIRIIYR